MGSDKAKELLDDAKNKVESAVHNVGTHLKDDAERLKAKLSHDHQVDEKLGELVASDEGEAAKKHAENDMAVDAVMLSHEE